MEVALPLGSSLSCFNFYLLYYAAVLIKFTLYAHYYAQEQEFLSDYYAFYMQCCMSNSLHVADSYIETALLECINERYQIILLCSITELLFY